MRLGSPWLRTASHCRKTSERALGIIQSSTDLAANAQIRDAEKCLPTCGRMRDWLFDWVRLRLSTGLLGSSDDHLHREAKHQLDHLFHSIDVGRHSHRRAYRRGDNNHGRKRSLSLRRVSFRARDFAVLIERCEFWSNADFAYVLYHSPAQHSFSR